MAALRLVGTEERLLDAQDPDEPDLAIKKIITIHPQPECPSYRKPRLPVPEVGAGPDRVRGGTSGAIPSNGESVAVYR